jgi:alpha-glucosidase (family GH31 glycosyl hydrolase)
VSFARSGWTGVHAVASVHWIGDQECTWSEYDGLPTVVPAMINLGLSGIPVSTHDVAGFSGGPSTKALFMRWTELGATQREVYLPDGATWFHAWTGEQYEGGQTIVIDAPVGSPPVFSRDEDRPALREIE